MLEKLLKKLGEKGYEVSWRYNIMLNCIDIRLERRFNKQWYKLNRMVTFEEMRYISGGQSAFEFAMTQILRWMVEKMEHDMGKHDGYFTKPFPDESEALRSPTDGTLSIFRSLLRKEKTMLDFKKQKELEQIRDILFNSNAIQCQDVAPEPVCDGMLSYYLYSYGMKIYVDFNKMAKALYEAGYRKGESDV